MSNWRIEYTDKAESNILSLDKEVARRILSFFRERVSVHPEPKQLAESLQGALRGLHRFRIGDYRAICEIQGNRLVVLVLEVAHRSVAYKRHG